MAALTFIAANVNMDETLEIVNEAADQTPLSVSGFSGQSVDLLHIAATAGGSSLLRVKSNGDVYINGATELDTVKTNANPSSSSHNGYTASSVYDGSGSPTTFTSSATANNGNPRMMYAYIYTYI